MKTLYNLSKTIDKALPTFFLFFLPFVYTVFLFDWLLSMCFCVWFFFFFSHISNMKYTFRRLRVTYFKIYYINTNRKDQKYVR